MRARVLHITTLLIKLLNTIIMKKELGRLAHLATPHGRRVPVQKKKANSDSLITLDKELQSEEGIA